MNKDLSRRFGTVVFFDLVGFSTRTDPEQARIAQAFMEVFRGNLTRLWGGPPIRTQYDHYMLLPTGDGAAIVIWDAAPGHPQREYTALWIAACLLAWAGSLSLRIGIRCGINQGEMYLIPDPYWHANVCGSAINIAARIMDAAYPGQLLASESEFIVHVNQQMVAERGELQISEITDSHEILVKHDELLTIRGIVGRISQGTKWIDFGIPGPPQAKWHLQIEPPSLALDSFGIRQIKKPPTELIAKHRKIAFIGATNDMLAASFDQVLNKYPQHNWETIEVYFLSDDKLTLLAYRDRTTEVLIRFKKTAINALNAILSSRCTQSFSLHEFNDLLYFASYWDWTEPGGRIHVSTHIWGADIKKCPAFDFVWKTKKPTSQYRAYMEGLEHLRRMSKPIAT